MLNITFFDYFCCKNLIWCIFSYTFFNWWKSTTRKEQINIKYINDITTNDLPAKIFSYIINWIQWYCSTTMSKLIRCCWLNHTVCWRWCQCKWRYYIRWILKEYIIYIQSIELNQTRQRGEEYYLEESTINQLTRLEKKDVDPILWLLTKLLTCTR